MRKTYQKYLALGLAVGTILLIGALEIFAAQITSSNEKKDVKFYGQINRAVFFADDGYESKIFHTDSTSSSTRIGVSAKAAPADQLSLGGRFEAEWQANPSHKISMDAESPNSVPRARHLDVFLSLKDRGKVFIGLGMTASDGTSEFDLSGTMLSGFANVAAAGGGFIFQEANGDRGSEQESPSITVQDVFSHMDGLGRKNRLRYDTPEFSGFKGAVSAGEQGQNDLAFRYEGTIGSTRMKAAIAWAHPGQRKEYSQFNGSSSLLFASGFNLTLAGGLRQLDDMSSGGENPFFIYGKIGYKTQLFSVGMTACSLDYGVYKNISEAESDQEGTAFGIQMVQQLMPYGIELYAGYRTIALQENSDADYGPLHLVMGGVRIKF